MLMHIIKIVFSSSTQTPPDLGQSSTGFAHFSASVRGKATGGGKIREAGGGGKIQH
jgi:hypothetical protein